MLEAACGWELAEPFDEESVKVLLANYIGSLPAVMETYIRELSGRREKN
ncbi:phage tail assembly chaperone [Campylobacter ornithocola]